MSTPANPLGTVVPGQTPGTTPPFMPSPGGAASGVDEQTKKIIQQLMQAAAQKKFAGTPRPTSVPGTANPMEAPSYMTSGPNPHAWGAQRLMYGVQTMIKNAVSRQKEQQITRAVADWEYAQSALNEYYAAQSSGDPEALKSAQGKLDVVFGDPKKLKNMAKALNQDWLNPEKTTVHGEALKRVAAETQQKDGAKQQAKSGIMGIFKKLIGQQQQPQMNEDEKKRMEQEIISKAPTTTGTFNIEHVKDITQLEKALTEARQKYQYIPSTDGSGTVWAVNKNDPKDAHIVRDSESGDAIKGGKAGAKEGQVYQVNGMPAGVFHGGKPVMPGDAEWSERDQKMFDQGVAGAKEKQFLRVEPAIAAMVGDPPNPADYKKGRSDPEYGKALKQWGEEVFKKEKEKAAAMGEARAIAMNRTRGVEIMDNDGNTYFTTMGKAIDEGFTGAGTGIKLKSRQAQIADIETASSKEREAIMSVDKAFTPAQIAKLKMAMTTDDESLAREELKALASENLTDKQQDFVVWTNQLNERAMSLRGIAGVGASAQDVRNAIRAMLPGIGSGSREMMEKQLNAFDQQVKVLKEGIAKPGRSGGGSSGTVMMLAPDGKTKKPVSKEQVQHYKDLGATVVQQ